MRKRLYVGILVFFNVACFAQSQDTITEYYDYEWKPCERKEALAYRKSVWLNENKLAVRDYYVNNDKIQMIGFYSDKNANIKTDSAIYYYENGRLDSCGWYEDNMKEGLWIHNFVNGNKESEGSYIKGKREGKWTFYHEGGKISSIEIYEADSLIKVRCWDEVGTPLTEYFETQDAEFPGGQDAMMSFLGRNLVYPQNLRYMGREGRVLISFLVSKEGVLRDFVVVKSDDEDFAKEALRVLTQMPKWSPTISHNRILETKMSIPIVFKLQ